MTKTIRLFLALAILGAAFAGCTTTPSKTAGESQAAGENGAAAQGAQTGGVGQATEFQGDELDNPDSPLAQRVIYFAFDKSDIQPDYLDLLSKHAQYLIDHPDVKVRLEGHTDERGSREYNIALGDRRAQAVRRFLLFQGVRSDQITTVSYGEERPADPGHNEQAWAKNRRVELVYLK
ncbi:MAG: peptidoglycan-associated lipoprotein Pal [Gammaproteobacteria bacterium]|jgi:peptidoglycan-associated lipoprotein